MRRSGVRIPSAPPNSLGLNSLAVIVLAVTPLRSIYTPIKSDSLTLSDAFLGPCGHSRAMRRVGTSLGNGVRHACRYHLRGVNASIQQSKIAIPTYLLGLEA